MRRKNKTRREGHGFVIDLHGMRQIEALHSLDLELNGQFIRGQSGGRVICGHGKGILLRVVGEALARHPLVQSFDRSPDGAAAYAVQLVAFSKGDPGCENDHQSFSLEVIS